MSLTEGVIVTLIGATVIALAFGNIWGFLAGIVIMATIVQVNR